MSNARQHDGSIHAGGEGIRDQVILPFSIAFGICMRGIRTRLGRSVVTLLGVALGITFLMAVVSGFHIKRAMQAESERIRQTDRRVAILRGEIGALAKKRVLVLASDPDAMDLRLLRALSTTHKMIVCLARNPGPAIPGTQAANLPGDLPGQAQGCAAIVGLGAFEKLPVWVDNAGALAGKAVLATGADRAEAIAGVRIRPLDIRLRPEEVTEQQRRDEEARKRMVWIVIVSLMITVIGIANAMLMSVTERIREIGTMKCLGALSSFVVKLFLIESSIIGLAGSALGAVAGMLFSFLAYAYTFGVLSILGSVSYGTLALYAGGSIVTGIVLAVVAAIYPARVAAKMIPAVALTSNV